MLQINIYENAIKRSDNIERFCFADFCLRNKNAPSDEQLFALRRTATQTIAIAVITKRRCKKTSQTEPGYPYSRNPGSCYVKIEN